MDTRKVALVTGANKGIGLAVVRALCKQFTGDVYLTSRDVSRGTAAVDQLKAEGLEPLFHQLDITDPTSVNAARDYFQRKYGGVDVLINNAGIAFKGADTTPFGIQAEMTLKTNFFANRDMCSVFLPVMKPGGRVVNVSSVMGEIALGRCSSELQTRFRSDALTEDELVLLMQQFIKDAQESTHLEKGWTDTAYGVSKIGLTILSRILAHRLRQDRPQDNILLNSCCPGWVKTDMSGHNGPLTPEQGADTPVYLALLPPGADEPHGQYLKERKVHES